MAIIFGIALSTCIASLALVYFLGYWGVLFAGLLSGILGAYLLLSLSGFGSPTAQVPTHNGLDFFITAIPIFIGGLLVYYGFYYLKVLISSEPVPRVLTIIWASSLILLVFFYMGNKVIKHIKEREIYIELGYDRELDLSWNDVSVSVANGGKNESISFNSGGGSKEKNSYGYSIHLSSFKKLYFDPQEIQVRILQKQNISISLPQGAESIHIYVDKDFYLKLFVNNELLSSHQLK